MRQMLTAFVALIAAAVVAADFTVADAPKPGETPLPIPADELRVGWTVRLPPFPLIQAPTWELSLVAKRPLSGTFRDVARVLASFGQVQGDGVFDTSREIFLRDAEGRLRVLPLPPRPNGYPADALVCLGVGTAYSPGFNCRDDEQVFDTRAFLPFRLDALLGHRAAKLRVRDPFTLPEPERYVRAQLRLAPKALGLPEGTPAGVISKRLRDRRAEFDPPPLPDGLFTVSRRGEERLVLTFSNPTDAPLTVQTLPHVAVMCERTAPSRGFGGRRDTRFQEGDVVELELSTPFILAPGERRDLPFQMAGGAKPGAQTTLLFSEPVMLGGELRTLRLPPIVIRGRRVEELLPRFDGAVLTLTQTLPEGARPAVGDCPLALDFVETPPFERIGAFALTSKANAPLRVEPAQETFAIEGLPDATVRFYERSSRLPPGASCTATPGKAPYAASLAQPHTLACRLYVLDGDNAYWALDAGRTYPAANPDAVREAFRKATDYRDKPPAEPFVPVTPATLAFTEGNYFQDAALPSLDPAWMRLGLTGDCLTLTLANPTEAPLTIDAGTVVFWNSTDVFDLDGKLVRNPSEFSANGAHLSFPRTDLAPGETRSVRWRVSGLVPRGGHDCLLYVEAPLLVDGERACVFRAELPLRDVSAAGLCVSPLP